MNRNIQSIVVALFMLAGTASAANAQTAAYSGPAAATPTAGYVDPSSAGGYAGPSGVDVTTVKQLLATGFDDQYATLRGKLVRYIGGKNYVFADSSGEMRVEISHKYFPNSQTIDANTLVEITGEFDREFVGQSELDVKQIRIISK